MARRSTRVVDEGRRRRRRRRWRGLPGLAEEVVLDEQGEDEHDSPLDGHGAQVPPHHVPAQGVFKAVFACGRKRQENRKYQPPEKEIQERPLFL